MLSFEVELGDCDDLLPPPLRGRDGEGGMPHAQVSRSHRTKAKSLRRAMTRAETLLWRQLKAHRLNGASFRRQAPMGTYTADFVSHTCRLVVEVDGESHDFVARQKSDAKRDGWLASRGYRVLRFTNDDVLKNLEGVVLTIAESLQSPPSLSLPRRKSGLPDLRLKVRNPGEPGLRGGGDPHISVED